jgi:hypothetical protein
MISIDQALQNPQLLGAALGSTKTWATWLATLKAAFGIKLNRAERRTEAGSRLSAKFSSSGLSRPRQWQEPHDRCHRRLSRVFRPHARASLGSMKAAIR